MQQATLFERPRQKADSARAANALTKSRVVLLERLALMALHLYVDEYDFPCEADTSFGVGQIAWMVACGASGPFCIARAPAQPPAVPELYEALDALAANGELICERHYLGTTGPGGDDYRGFSYRYRVTETS